MLFSKKWNLCFFSLSTSFMLFHFAQSSLQQSTFPWTSLLEVHTIPNTIEINLRVYCCHNLPHTHTHSHTNVKKKKILHILPHQPCLIFCPSVAGRQEDFFLKPSSQRTVQNSCLMAGRKKSTTGKKASVPNLCLAPNFRGDAQCRENK